MALAIKDFARDRHKHVAVLNRLIGSKKISDNINVDRTMAGSVNDRS